MTFAYWHAGELDAAARAVRDWARVEGQRPAPHRFASRIYEDIGAIDLAEEAAERAALRAPDDAGAWERVGRLRLHLHDREGALDAIGQALALNATDELKRLLAEALALEPDAALRRWNGSRAYGARAHANGAGAHASGSGVHASGAGGDENGSGADASGSGADGNGAGAARNGAGPHVNGPGMSRAASEPPAAPLG